MRAIPPDAIEQAVAEGVITAGQRDAILSIARRGEPPSQPQPEAPRGLHPVMMAYTVGALLVLFGFGWFLRDRWHDLGPPGVLLIAIAFGAVFIVAARMLRRMGFPAAAGWSAALAVVMAPLAMWAALRLTGLWPEPASIMASEPTLQAWLALKLELTVVAAALIALRFIAFPHLGLEIAAAVALMVPSFAVIIYGPDFGHRMTTWILHTVGFGLVAIGYAAHRRGAESELSNWFYLIGLMCVTSGWVGGWSRYDFSHAALPVVSLMSLAAAVYLRRRVFFLFGVIGLLGWLSWLAFDVFRNVAGFPVVLATFGTCVILLTVWAQRRYPALVARVEASRGDRRGTLPGDHVTATLPLVISLVLLVLLSGTERERVQQEDARMRRAMHEAALQRRRAEGGPPRPFVSPTPPTDSPTRR